VAKRSPILGYNHNFRHRGLVFHVQTEDSGVDNPHIFTHLFHGGVILSSRKLDYDAAAAEEVVKSLMQAQHRAVLKDLKRGTFDGKIDAYLGSHPDLEPPEADAAARIAAAEVADASRDSAEVDQLVASAAVELAASRQSVAQARQAVTQAKSTPRARNKDVSAAFDAVRVPEEVEDEVSGGVAEIHSPAPASAPPPPGIQPQRPGTYSQHRRPSGRIEPIADPVKEEPPAPAARPRRGSGVVVSRPAVIVGAPPQAVGGNRQARPARRAREDRAGDSLFGQDLISEKSLDEVILAYLSEDGSED
jgi:hypothetical protein